MAKFELPDSFSFGLNFLAKLNDASMSNLCDVVQAAKVNEQPEELSQKDHKGLKATTEELRELYSTVFSLYQLFYDIGDGEPNLVDDIVNSYSQSHKLDNKDRSTLSKNLKALFDTNSSILQTVKGFALLSEGDKVFMKSKIVSDIRLVFDSSIARKTRGAVLVHSLKITYREGGEWRDTFITMDSSDLHKLKNSISRAIEKEELIYNNTFTKELLFVKPKKSNYES